MVHAIDKELQSYLKLLNLSQKESLLDIMKSYLKPSGQRKGITIEEYNKEIEDSEAEIERGESFTHEEVMKLSKNWTSAK